MIPFLIGAALKYGSDIEASNRKARLLKAMQAYQQGKGLATESAIRDLVAQQTPAARATELQGAQASRAASEQASVDAVRAASPSTVVANAASSPEYQAKAAQAADTVATRTKRAIEQLSVMGAPSDVQLAFNKRRALTAGTVDADNAAIGNVGNAYLTTIDNTRPNPYAQAAGSALMAYDAPALGSKKFAASGATDGSGAEVFANSGETTGGPVYQPNTFGTRVKRAFSLWGSR